MDFPLGALQETASHSGAEKWDALSAGGRRGKTKAPIRDGAGAKGAACVVDAERELPVSNAVRALPYPR